MNDKVLIEYCNYLLSQRNNLEIELFNLRKQLADVSVKQGTSQEESHLGSREFHKPGTSSETPGTVS